VRIAIILALLLLSLDKEEFDDFVELMQMIQGRNEIALQTLANLHRELNKIEE